MVINGKEALDIVLLNTSDTCVPEYSVQKVEKATKKYIIINREKFSTKTGSIKQNKVGTGQHKWNKAKAVFLKAESSKYFQLLNPVNYVIDKETLKIYLVPELNDGAPRSDNEMEAILDNWMKTKA